MNKRIKIEISAFTSDGSDSWFFATNINRLFYKNVDTNEEKDCGQVPWEDANADNLYRGIEYSDGKVYLIPYKARSLAVYDINQGLFEEVRLPREIIDGKKFLFKACLKYNQNIYAFGIHSRSIMVIRTKEQKVDFITDWIDRLNNYVSCPNGILSRKQIAVLNDKVYLPLYYGDAVMVFNLKDERVSFHKINGGNTGYSGICKFGDGLVLAGKGPNENIVLWDEKNDRTNLIGQIIIEDCTTDTCVIQEEDLVSAYLDKSQNIEISKNENIRIYENYECVGSGYDKTYFWNRGTGEVEVIEEDKKTRQNTEVCINKEISKNILNTQAGLKEQSNFGIKEFLEIISME